MLMRRTLRALSAFFLLLAYGTEVRAGSMESVHFETSDGFTLRADLTASENPSAPVAILLHMYRSNRKAWMLLTPRLSEAGFTVLAVDQRAHGESTRKGDQTVHVSTIPRSEFGNVVRQGPSDVEAAQAFLRKRGLSTDRIVLFGASYGCTVSLLSSGQVEAKALVLLSPGTSYFGVDVTEAARRFPHRILAVAAEDDPRAVESAEAIVRIHEGTDRVVIYRSGGHGTKLFTGRPDVLDLVVDFAGESVGP
jgi:pimeloyl-ACP methyl ester carboxylesterase